MRLSAVDECPEGTHLPLPARIVPARASWHLAFKASSAGEKNIELSCQSIIVGADKVMYGNLDRHRRTAQRKQCQIMRLRGKQT
jgi:hypothetical protein